MKRKEWLCGHRQCVELRKRHRRASREVGKLRAEVRRLVAENLQLVSELEEVAEYSK